MWAPINRSLALLPLLALLVAPMIGCGAEVEDGEDAIAGEDEIRSPKTLKCTFTNLAPIWGEAFDNGYILSLSGTKAVGAYGPNDDEPDRFTFKRREGDDRFYLTDDKLPVPPTVSQGKWSVVMGLSVPPAVAEGRAGKVTISFWVKKGNSFTPYAGSETQKSILRWKSSTLQLEERTLLDGVDEMARSDLRGNCKP